MNKILLARHYPSLLILFLLLSNYFASGQLLLDTISQKDLCFSSVLVGSTSSILLASFGKPDSIVSHINEFEDTEGSKYFYKKSSFTVENGKFTIPLC